MAERLTEQRLLGPEREQILADARRLLGDLRGALAKIQPESDDEEALKQSIDQLDDLFLLVVIGEFNSGKSAFVNALLGTKALEEGVTPTTAKIQVVRHGETIEKTSVSDSTDRITAPLELLKDLSLVDTPGTNAIDRRHEAITRHFVPRADLILFVTSADRPFTETERAFLEGVRDWGKKIVAVVNKADILETPEDREKVRAFVASSFKTLLGVETDVFLVSAKRAYRAKEAGDDAALAESGFHVLEQYIHSTLDEQERFRLKLRNPLGVADRLIAQYSDVVGNRLELLQGDLDAVEQIQGQLDVYDRDMRNAYRLRFADIDLILHQFEGRGQEFFEEMIRLGRVFDLLNKSRVQSEFERLVVADAPQRIESKADEIIDWLVESDLRQWEAVRDHFERRRSEHSERIMGKLSSFEYDRTRLLDTVGTATKRTLEGYDRAEEARRMADSVQNAVANTAILEAGAVGLGAAVSLVATSSAVDFTGIVAAGLMATVGLFVLPHRKRTAKKELRAKLEELRTQLRTSLDEQFEKEITRSRRRIEETIAPYTRFVESERDKLATRQGELKGFADESRALRERIR